MSTRQARRADYQTMLSVLAQNTGDPQPAHPSASAQMGTMLSTVVTN